MKLGDQTVGLRKTSPRVDGDGQPVRDEYGDQLIDAVDVEVRWCLMTPSEARSDTTEAENRAAPAITGYQLLAPPDTDVRYVDAVIWPITGRSGDGDELQLDGRVWQVVGEPGLWDEAVEVRLRAST